MTGGTNKHPFANDATISREQLLSYAEGRSTPREQFNVELAAVNDPLLSDALEGLMVPGAIDGLDDLMMSQPKFRLPRRWFWMFSLLIIAPLILLERKEDPIEITDRTSTGTTIADLDETTIRSNAEEPFAPMEKKDVIRLKTEMIPVPRKDLSVAIDRTGSIDRVEPISIDVTLLSNIPDRRIKSVHRNRSGLQLHYLHDLKLIHPKELYPFDPKIDLAARNLSADRADRNAQDLKILEPIKQSYLDFMDEALRHYAQSDPAKCISELQFLLDQYPDDVNALFYAGMCRLQLKEYKAARQLLSRVIHDHRDVFIEEADFYHAEAVDGSGDHGTAIKEFQRIANKGGFYAERARGKIEH